MCSPHVNDLIYWGEEADTGLDHLKKLESICERITSCYGAMNCEASKDLKNLYERKCERMEFESYDMTDCMSQFYSAVYEEKDSCTKDFNYFSKDMRLKREAYTTGKSCLLNFARKKCGEPATWYLDAHYATLLKILTEPVEDVNCKSLHKELIGRQCEPLTTSLLMEMMMVPISSMTGKNNISLICGQMTDCMSENCFFTSKNNEEMDHFCKRADDVIGSPKNFDECYAFIGLNVGKLNYECTNHSLLFLLDKKCVKTVMHEECGQFAISNFDEDWERTEEEKQEFGNSGKLSSLDYDK